MLSLACGSDEKEPADAAITPQLDAELGAIDASAGDGDAADADTSIPDAMQQADYELTVAPGAGGSIDIGTDSSDLGNCASGQVCTRTIASGTLVILAPVPGTLQHCTWTGDCAGFPKGSSCVKMMTQDFSVGATFDASDADCL